ncbi:MAG: pilus assembly protein PilM [Opitutales bacterium]
MSGSKRLIINCGASSVTAAVLSSHAGGHHVDKLVSEPLRYDYSNEESWMGAVTDAFRALAQNHHLSGKATFIIPGSQILTKTIRVPHVEASKRAQVVAFEAQQNIPYPLHEVVWDSQVISDDGVESEVLFIACKSQAINRFCEQAASAGLKVEAISAATVLELNALRLAYPKLDEDLLLINVGARSTNLLFCSPDGFFVRNIALGGNTLTQNIADSLGQPFTQAESIKRKFFSEEADYSEDDAGSKALISSADSFIRRMSQEITRSIVNYRRQRKGSTPKRILLTGRGALLKGLSEKLAEAQKTKVEFFDPLQSVTLDGSIDIEDDGLRMQLSEIIGEACRDTVPEPAGVDLLPERIRSTMRFNRQKPFLLLAAACLAAAPWPVYSIIQAKGEAYAEQAEAIEAAITPLEQRNERLADLRERARALGASIQRVEGLKNSKSNWIQFFAELQESLTSAEDVWLDALSVEREQPEDGEQSYEVVVSGQMLVRETAEAGERISQAALSRRIKSLQASFEESEFVVDSGSPVITWTSLREGFNVLPFRINLVVDTTKPL